MSTLGALYLGGVFDQAENRYHKCQVEMHKAILNGDRPQWFDRPPFPPQGAPVNARIAGQSWPRQMCTCGSRDGWQSQCNIHVARTSIVHAGEGRYLQVLKNIKQLHGMCFPGDHFGSDATRGSWAMSVPSVHNYMAAHPSLCRLGPIPTFRHPTCPRGS